MKLFDKYVSERTLVWILLIGCLLFYFSGGFRWPARTVERVVRIERVAPVMPVAPEIPAMPEIRAVPIVPPLPVQPAAPSTRLVFFLPWLLATLVKTAAAVLFIAAGVWLIRRDRKRREDDKLAKIKVDV